MAAVINPGKKLIFYEHEHKTAIRKKLFSIE